MVISTKGSGFYLGDGEDLLESGEVVPLSEVLELRPPQSGIFRLELPDEVDHGDDWDGEDQETEDTGETAPSAGSEAPTADVDDAGDEPSEPAARAEGGAAPAPEEAEPDVLPAAAGFEAGEMPDPTIASELQDLDGDGISDDNNGNGLVDVEEPLPNAPVAEDPAPVLVDQACPHGLPSGRLLSSTCQERGRECPTKALSLGERGSPALGRAVQHASCHSWFCGVPPPRHRQGIRAGWPAGDWHPLRIVPVPSVGTVRAEMTPPSARRVR